MREGRKHFWMEKGQTAHRGCQFSHTTGVNLTLKACRQAVSDDVIRPCRHVTVLGTRDLSWLWQGPSISLSDSPESYQPLSECLMSVSLRLFSFIHLSIHPSIRHILIHSSIQPSFIHSFVQPLLWEIVHELWATEMWVFLMHGIWISVVVFLCSGHKVLILPSH